VGVTDAGQRAPVRVAVVGAGYMAREHIRAFTGLPGVTVAGIQSRTRTRAESLAEEFGIPLVSDSVQELHDATQADLVVVTVPELAMNGVASACFRFSWTVLLEKPAGYDFADGEAIATSASKAKRRVFVALNRRHYSSTQVVRDALAGHAEPRFIKVQDQEDPAQALEGGQPPLVVTNWMYANSIHLIDFFRIFGRGKITAVTPVIPWRADAPGVVVSYIQFDSGDQGVYEGLWNAPAPWSVSVTLPSERWELRPIEQASVQKRGERRAQLFDPHPRDLEFKAGLRAQAEAAVAAARGEDSTLATLEDALETMRLTRMIFGL
jgi:predicted dehydrogenase